jgi:hypothetical protein
MFLLTSTAALATGSMDGIYFYCESATPVLNLASIVTIAAGATPTISRYGVFVADADTGNLLSLAAATTNDTALFTSTDIRRKAPSSGAEVSGAVWSPVRGRYYFIGALCVSAASMPTFVSPTSVSTTNIYNIGGASKAMLQSRFASLSDLPASFPLAPSSSLTRAPVVVGEYS